jgi:hypothetical protein
MNRLLPLAAALFALVMRIRVGEWETAIDNVPDTTWGADIEPAVGDLVHLQVTRSPMSMARFDAVEHELLDLQMRTVFAVNI